MEESEFIKLWNVRNDKYKTFTDYNFGYIDRGLIYQTLSGKTLATCWYLRYTDGDKPGFLCIHNGSNETEEFMRDYGIEPYTYSVDFYENIPSFIKPFTYNKIPDNIDKSSLPLCVVHCDPDVSSVLKARDERMETIVVRKLQNGEPITWMKSARN